MKIYTVAALACFSVGCTTNGTNKTQERPELTPVVLEILTEKLHKNAPLLFCEQSGYAECFDISRGECLTDIKELNEGVTVKTENKFSSLSNENFEEYIKYYSVNLLLGHVGKYPENIDKVTKCMAEFSFNKEVGVVSLFK